jgi:hypothetical protein
MYSRLNEIPATANCTVAAPPAVVTVIEAEPGLASGLMTNVAVTAPLDDTTSEILTPA